MASSRKRPQPALSLKSTLRLLHLSPSRYHQWRQAERICGIDDEAICPRFTPTRLTAEELITIKTMIESPEYRHVSTGRLAILAQRIGRVFAAPGTSIKQTAVTILNRQTKLVLKATTPRDL